MIKVGGATEIEVKERKDRVDDALHATRAAVEEGIVPGGGVALLRAIKALEGLKADNDDQKVGIDIVRKALQAPARQIVQNAGEDGSVVVGKILENAKYTFGYNAQTGEYGDLVSRGRHRPDQGGALRAAGCGLGRRPADHHRGDGGRAAEGGRARRCPGRRHGRNGWHGRHGLLRPASTPAIAKSPGHAPGLFFVVLPRPTGAIVKVDSDPCAAAMPSRLPSKRSISSAQARRRCMRTAWHELLLLLGLPALAAYILQHDVVRAQSRKPPVFAEFRSKLALDGHDPVAYFKTGKPTKGLAQHAA